MTPFEDLPVWTMAEWMGQKAEIERLRAELAEARDDLSEVEFCSGCNGGEWTWQRRAEEAEEKIEQLRELCNTWEYWYLTTYDDPNTHCSGTVYARMEEVRAIFGWEPEE